MNQKITIKVAEISYKKKEVEIVKTAYIPIWASSESNCEICGFSFREYPNQSENDTILVLKTSSGDKLYIHPECLNRAKKEREKDE